STTSTLARSSRSRTLCGFSSNSFMPFSGNCLAIAATLASGMIAFPLRPGSRAHQHRQVRRQIRRPVYALRRLVEIGFLGVVDVHERLGIAVHQWEPAALNLHHDAVARAEGVVAVLQPELHARRLTGGERLGFLKAIAELAAHHIPAD